MEKQRVSSRIGKPYQTLQTIQPLTGWWFGTCFFFPVDWEQKSHLTTIFQRGLGQPPTR